jgi:hypothetical protein
MLIHNHLHLHILGSVGQGLGIAVVDILVGVAPCRILHDPLCFMELFRPLPRQSLINCIRGERNRDTLPVWQLR